MLSKHLKDLENESIRIFREVVATAKKPAMLYSVGKDSSVMLRLAQKAFFPGKIPFPLIHIDTSYKFQEMYEFRDNFVNEIGAKLFVEGNDEWIKKGAHPSQLGNDKCCALLKTQGLLGALKKHEIDMAFGGARRDEEKSRAKERIASLRDEFGTWDPKNQRSELWSLYNLNLSEGQSLRIFPLSNWTETNIWEYIKAEEIPIVPLYYAKKRKCVRRGGIIIPVEFYGTYDPENKNPISEDEIEEVSCRYRSLGCSPCTGAIESSSTNIDGILNEVIEAKKSERENRIIDLTSDSSMEQKKREGYF